MQPAEHPLLALAFRLAGAVAFSGMFVLVKYAGRNGAAVPEIMFWRQFVPVVLLLAWLAATGNLSRLRSQRRGAHARRAVLGMTGMLTGFTAMVLLPLAEATTLTFTTPLFVVILAAVMLREQVGFWRWGAVILGFVGIVVIAQPGHAPVSAVGTFAGLAAGMIAAFTAFQVRDLARTEGSIATVFYFSLFGSLFTAPFLPFVMTPHDGGQWVALLGAGVCGMLGQILITMSLRHGTVASVVVMDYTLLIWAIFYGWLLWDELPPLTTWLGAPAIIAAGLIVIWREQRKAGRTGPATAIELE